MSGIEPPRVRRHRYDPSVLDAHNLPRRHIDMANHAVNRARITIVGLVLSHKGNTAQRAMPCRNFRIGITTSRPRVYLNALEILLGLASNA